MPDVLAVCIILLQTFISITTNDSPGARAAGACTCERSAEENKVPSGDLCSCGARPAGMFFSPHSSSLSMRIGMICELEY